MPFIIEFLHVHVFSITFHKDAMIICLFCFSSSLTKFVYKCYVVLLVIISGILDVSFVEFRFDLTRFGDVKSAQILFQYVGFW